MTENIKMAKNLDELPPLREGYVRLVHQTHSASTDNIVEKGLIYNKEFAGINHGANYVDISSMAIEYNEESFWNSLTKEDIKHGGADKKVIFDLPAEEASAHNSLQISQYLSGTISKEYIVGVVDNYGNEDLKLSNEEMLKIKEKSLKNPLPELNETKNWREDIAQAWQKHEDFHSIETDFLGNPIVQNNNIENNGFEFKESGNFDASDFDDDFGDEPQEKNETNIRIEKARNTLALRNKKETLIDNYKENTISKPKEKSVNDIISTEISRRRLKDFE